MLRVLYHCYFSAPEREILRINDFRGRLWAFIIRKIMPLLYKISIPFQKSGIRNGSLENEVVVSLTSYPGRINKAWLSIESILRQTYRPDKIILWLGKEHFSGISALPSILRRQMKRGLDIQFREDLKPHTKYFYALKENPDAILVTIDDDVFYPPDMLDKLIYFHHRFPNAVICHGARKIDSTEIGFADYKKWDTWHSVEIESKERFDLLPLGVMGVLYPPKSLHVDVFNIGLLKKTSFKADDLWLKAMALKEGTKAHLTNTYPKALVCLPDSQSESLMTYNIIESQNDRQLEALDNEFKIFQIYQSLIS